MKAPKVMIVGFDAATWDLAKSWVAEGFMPNLARLIAEGTHGQTDRNEPLMKIIAKSDKGSECGGTIGYMTFWWKKATFKTRSRDLRCAID